MLRVTITIIFGRLLLFVKHHRTEYKHIYSFTPTHTFIDISIDIHAYILRRCIYTYTRIHIHIFL